MRHEVAYAIVLTSRKAGQETGRSVDRSLPVHALLTTTTCEATGTTWLASGLEVQEFALTRTRDLYRGWVAKERISFLRGRYPFMVRKDVSPRAY